MKIEPNDPKWQAFLDWAHREGWTQEVMAEECVTSRAHLNQVLTGVRCGRLTWKRLARVLPVDGLLLLQQCSSWNEFAEKALQKRIESDKLAKIAERCRADQVEVAP